MLAADDFRQLLGRFATGVTVITTTDSDGRPAGLTASAFTSVSLDPPLVLVCVDRQAQSFGALEASGRFAVNVLDETQEALSRRFATRQSDKFTGVPHTTGVLGLPLVDDALAQLECLTVAAYRQGDHTIFVGRVEAGRTGSGAPLLYYRGAYRRLPLDDR